MSESSDIPSMGDRADGAMTAREQRVFERQLLELQPVETKLSEAEIVYRSGWEAAMSAASAESSSRRNSVAPFLGGTAAGLAASLLGMVLWGELNTKPADTRFAESGFNSSPHVVGHAPNPVLPTPGGPQTELAQNASGGPLLPEDQAPHDLAGAGNVLAALFPWRGPNSASFSSIATQPQRPMEDEALSVAARKSWGDTLGLDHASREGVFPVTYERPKSTLGSSTLGELLFQMDEHGFY